MQGVRGSKADATEVVGLCSDPGANHGLGMDQASLYRCVAEGNLHSLVVLLNHRKGVDINGYNSEGLTALHLAVCKYESSRNVDVAKALLTHGGNVLLKSQTSVHKICIVRHDGKHPQHDFIPEAKKVSIERKTPLLIALELKSSLYLRGWEYRHWDPLIKLLAEATYQNHRSHGVKPSTEHETRAIVEVITKSWDSVFQSGKHDVIEIYSEGKSFFALKLLLVGASKVFKSQIEMMKLDSTKPQRIEMNDTSFNLAKNVVRYIYTGNVDPHFMKQRSIDLFVTAHKYGVESLKQLCEAQIEPTQDNWIKLLHAASDCDSPLLELNCAKSIKEVMELRQDSHRILKKSFSEVADDPQQLFGSTHADTRLL